MATRLVGPNRTDTGVRSVPDVDAPDERAQLLANWNQVKENVGQMFAALEAKADANELTQDDVDLVPGVIVETVSKLRRERPLRSSDFHRRRGRDASSSRRRDRPRPRGDDVRAPRHGLPGRSRDRPRTLAPDPTTGVSADSIEQPVMDSGPGGRLAYRLVTDAPLETVDERDRRRAEDLELLDLAPAA